MSDRLFWTIAYGVFVTAVIATTFVFSRLVLHVEFHNPYIAGTVFGGCWAMFGYWQGWKDGQE